MPNMHRLAVFRDDIIFLIFLYQRWIYPVDKKRGVQLPADDDEVVSPQQSQPLQQTAATAAAATTSNQEIAAHATDKEKTA